jgi:regulator of protease activity HflC (stomatin/prohibitin superfamily)
LRNKEVVRTKSNIGIVISKSETITIEMESGVMADKQVARPVRQLRQLWNPSSLNAASWQELYIKGFVAVVFMSLAFRWLWVEYWRFMSTLTISEKAESLALAFVAFLIFLLLVLFIPVHIVEQTDRAVIYFLGLYMDKRRRVLRGVRGPGMFLTIPFLETIKELVDMRDRSRHFIASECWTFDKVPLDLEGDFIWRVLEEEAERLVIQVEDPELAVRGVVESAVKDAAGELTFDEVNSERQKVVNMVMESVKELLDRWGVELISMRITDVRIRSLELQRTFSDAAQAKVDREKRLMLAQYEVQIAQSLDEATAIYEENEIAYQLRMAAYVLDLAQSPGEGKVIMVPSGLTDFFAKVGVVAPAGGGGQSLPESAQE